jgi:hypothetical protein
MGLRFFLFSGRRNRSKMARLAGIEPTTEDRDAHVELKCATDRSSSFGAMDAL